MICAVERAAGVKIADIPFSTLYASSVRKGEEQLGKVKNSQ